MPSCKLLHQEYSYSDCRAPAPASRSQCCISVFERFLFIPQVNCRPALGAPLASIGRPSLVRPGLRSSGGRSAPSPSRARCQVPCDVYNPRCGRSLNRYVFPARPLYEEEEKRGLTRWGVCCVLVGCVSLWACVSAFFVL